jgi:hypothetical protein
MIPSNFLYVGECNTHPTPTFHGKKIEVFNFCETVHQTRSWNITQNNNMILNLEIIFDVVTAYKMLPNILLARFTPYVSEVTGDHLCGFRRNRVLRNIFGPEREEDGWWRKLHNDELHSLYSSPNIVRVVKSRRVRWVGHVARMGERGVFTGFWLEGPKARDHWEDLGIGGGITLRWTLGR